MADQTEEPAPKRKAAPPRNDFKRSVLYRNSRALELQNRDPEYVYESFSTDPESPAYIGKRLTTHERGSPMGGFVTVGPWEVVHSQTDRNVRAMEPREDQGKPIDTVMRYGRQIMCRIHRDEYAKYKVAEEASQVAQEKLLFEPDRMSDGNVRLTTALSRDENVDKMDLLRQSGHQFPGG